MLQSWICLKPNPLSIPYPFQLPPFSPYVDIDIDVVLCQWVCHCDLEFWFTYLNLSTVHLLLSNVSTRSLTLGQKSFGYWPTRPNDLPIDPPNTHYQLNDPTITRLTDPTNHGPTYRPTDSNLPPDIRKSRGVGVT
mgnify:CR=1 FL=1